MSRDDINELLRPRYKVIADYPGNIQPIGHIYKVIGDMASVYYWCIEKEKYPHLFKKLEWWEHRDPKDFPDYLKDIGDGEIFKVMKYLDNKEALIALNKNSKQNHTGVHQASLQHFLPATQADYDNYKTLNPC